MHLTVALAALVKMARTTEIAMTLLNQLIMGPGGKLLHSEHFQQASADTLLKPLEKAPISTREAAKCAATAAGVSGD
jgi:hypothetical protein